jgi:hypothetical protein
MEGEIDFAGRCLTTTEGIHIQTPPCQPGRGKKKKREKTYINFSYDKA